MTDCIAPIAPTDPDHFLRLSEEARDQGADLIELRLDLAARAGADPSALVAAIPRSARPVLATCRHRSEGGAWQGDEAARLGLLLAADAAGAHMIDVELAHIEALPERPKRARLVLSHHDFNGPGEGLPGIVERMRNAGADIAKIAVTARDAADLGPLAALAESHGDQPLIALAMGPYGLPSRLLAGAWGLAATFGRLAGDTEGTAPGQPTVQELLVDYRLGEQTRETCIFGVIGNPIAHSLSPAIHNAAFQHDRIDAVYVPFLVADAPAFWDACRGWIDGLSITIPHKHALLDACVGIEDIAAEIGAINTLFRNPEGEVIGANTDAPAALDCIASLRGELQGARCLLLGAGGVSRAIAYALHEVGAEVWIANRTPERAEALASEVGCRWATWDAARSMDYDVLVNGTSVGMREDQSPWPPEAHRPGSVVFDTVYTPLETTLLRQADAAGCHGLCGLRMFIKQAAGQYLRWTGRGAPEAVMQRIALERLGATRKA